MQAEDIEITIQLNRGQIVRQFGQQISVMNMFELMPNIEPKNQQNYVQYAVHVAVGVIFETNNRITS